MPTAETATEVTGPKPTGRMLQADPPVLTAMSPSPSPSDVAPPRTSSSPKAATTVGTKADGPLDGDATCERFGVAEAIDGFGVELAEDVLAASVIGGDAAAGWLA